MSDRETEEISEEERRYENGESPSVLDVIQIPMLKHTPVSYQSENHLIDDGYYWKRTQHASWQDVIEATNRVQGDLWCNGYNSTNGKNDRIPDNVAGQLNSSLLLIEPKDLTIHSVRTLGKKQVRARFNLNGQHYDLAVTDPEIERRYLRMEGDGYPIPGARLCISLGEMYNKYVYKLVASIITEEKARQRQ